MTKHQCGCDEDKRIICDVHHEFILDHYFKMLGEDLPLAMYPSEES